MHQINTVSVAILIVAGGLSGAALADPASDHAQAATTLLTGTWSGTWQRTSQPPGDGTYKLTLTQDGTEIKGTIEAQRSACLTKHAITGTVSGDKVQFHVSDKGVTANYTGKVSGGHMSGTATVSCAVGTGTANWEVTKR